MKSIDGRNFAVNFSDLRYVANNLKTSNNNNNKTRFHKQFHESGCPATVLSLRAERDATAHLHQEAVLQGRAGLTVLDGLGGEK